ncbi:DUF6193 family natural product biosynthesis protein [Streptomyces sp. NPDC012421]|uniref:DUF6193 family natural product biosynthesis protein n=1 Tax=Streptomyces sp. NPDC012421 TaxID=3364832 RepID=UPI0036ED1138
MPQDPDAAALPHAAAENGYSGPTGPDPARLVESEWRRLRAQATELDTSWAEDYRSLVEAAYAEPRLRALYPFTSHWCLRFSAATRPLLDVVGPNLTTLSGGGYRVALLMSERGRACGTAREAVAEAVRLLPEGVGPVRYGAVPGDAGNAVEGAEGA